MKNLGDLAGLSKKARDLFTYMLELAKDDSEEAQDAAETRLLYFVEYSGWTWEESNDLLCRVSEGMHNPEDVQSALHGQLR